MKPHYTPMSVGDEDGQYGPTCFECDAPADTKWQKHTFTYGLDDSAVELPVNLPVRICSSCGFEFLDHEAEILKHEAVCVHLGVLSPKEIRAIREAYGLSRNEFAQVTGLGEATLNRWENGIKIQTLANDRYLRLLSQSGNMQWLKNLKSAARTTPADTNFREGKFRVLHVSDDVLQNQQHFQLAA